MGQFYILALLYDKQSKVIPGNIRWNGILNYLEMKSDSLTLCEMGGNDGYFNGLADNALTVQKQRQRQNS